MISFTRRPGTVTHTELHFICLNLKPAVETAVETAVKTAVKTAVETAVETAVAAEAFSA